MSIDPQDVLDDYVPLPYEDDTEDQDVTDD